MFISIELLSKLTAGSRWTFFWELKISKFLLGWLLTLISPYFMFLLILLPQIFYK